jgi:hypothetical protein
MDCLPAMQLRLNFGNPRIPARARLRRVPHLSQSERWVLPNFPREFRWQRRTSVFVAQVSVALFAAET